LALAALIGAAVFVVPHSSYYSYSTAVEKGRQAAEHAAWFLGLTKKKPIPAKTNATPEPLTMVQSLPSVVSEASAPVNPNEASLPVAPPLAPVQITPEAPPVVAAPPVKKAKRRPSKRSRKKKPATQKAVAVVPAPVKNPPVEETPARPAAVETPAPPKPAASTKGAYGNLVGKYVSLELKTGRSVKGILEDVSPTVYKVQLPGLGSFTYPVENVKDIKPAE